MRKIPVTIPSATPGLYFVQLHTDVIRIRRARNEQRIIFEFISTGQLYVRGIFTRSDSGNLDWILERTEKMVSCHFPEKLKL